MFKYAGDSVVVGVFTFTGILTLTLLHRLEE